MSSRMLRPAACASGLGGDAVGKLVGQLRPLDARPGEGEGRAELLQEVAHPRSPAREAVEEEGAHDAPAKPGAVGDRFVDLRGGGDPVVDEVEGLAPHRFEEAVGDERVDLRVEDERMHPDRPVEGGGPLLRLPGRGLPTHHLDEGQQVDGDEGMAHHDPLRPGAARLEAAREEPRSRGGDDRVGGRGPARAGEEGALHLLALGHALLDEGRPLDRFLDARRDLDPAGGNGRREGEPGVGAGGVLERLVDPAPRARGSGSWTRTSMPFTANRAAHPAPTTPAPRRATRPMSLMPPPSRRMRSSPCTGPRSAVPRTPERGSSRPRVPDEDAHHIGHRKRSEAPVRPARRRPPPARRKRTDRKPRTRDSAAVNGNGSV